MSGQVVSKFRSGGPGFKPRPLPCFLRQGILLHTFSLYTSVQMGTDDILGGGGGGLASHPGEVAIILGMLHAKQTRISSGHLGLWLVCAFFTFLPFIP